MADEARLWPLVLVSLTENQIDAVGVRDPRLPNGMLVSLHNVQALSPNQDRCVNSAMCEQQAQQFGLRVALSSSVPDTPSFFLRPVNLLSKATNLRITFFVGIALK